MNPVITEYLSMTSVKLAVVTDDEIVIGRVSVKVFPSVQADDLDRILMEFPADLQPDEAGIPMILKGSLVGYDQVIPLIVRLRESLHAGKEHIETIGPWNLRFSDQNGIHVFEATPST